MKEKKLMHKKTLVSWTFCQRKPSVNAGNRITSDTLIIDEGFPSFYKIKLRD